MADPTPVVVSFDGAPAPTPRGPEIPFKRPVRNALGQIFLRVGGKGTKMPGKIPDLPPAPGTFAAHVVTRNTHFAIAAAAKMHGRLQSNSELSIEAYDELVDTVANIQISAR
jgi:hypothetical protein